MPWCRPTHPLGADHLSQDSPVRRSCNRRSAAPRSVAATGEKGTSVVNGLCGLLPAGRVRCRLSCVLVARVCRQCLARMSLHYLVISFHQRKKTLSFNARLAATTRDWLVSHRSVSVLCLVEIHSANLIVRKNKIITMLFDWR